MTTVGIGAVVDDDDAVCTFAAGAVCSGVVSAVVITEVCTAVV